MRAAPDSSHDRRHGRPEPVGQDRPVWLLDVDGVLNATRPSWGAAPRQGTAIANGQAWTLRWAPPVVDFVRQVATSGEVEIRWCTTWVGWTGSVEQCLALPKLPDAFEPDVPDMRHAKAQSALAVVETERRALIWTDDDAIPAPGPLRERLERADVPVLLISPHSRRGLQPQDVARIQEFISANRVRQ